MAKGLGLVNDSHSTAMAACLTGDLFPVQLTLVDSDVDFLACFGDALA
jgi:hypothetical protein